MSKDARDFDAKVGTASAGKGLHGFNARLRRRVFLHIDYMMCAEAFRFVEP